MSASQVASAFKGLVLRNFRAPFSQNAITLMNARLFSSSLDRETITERVMKVTKQFDGVKQEKVRLNKYHSWLNLKYLYKYS